MSRKRNPNFTDAELQILLDEVERNKSILFSKLSNVHILPPYLFYKLGHRMFILKLGFS